MSCLLLIGFGASRQGSVVSFNESCDIGRGGEVGGGVVIMVAESTNAVELVQSDVMIGVCLGSLGAQNQTCDVRLLFYLLALALLGFFELTKP
jgi:hypothetical protein